MFFLSMLHQGVLTTPRLLQSIVQECAHNDVDFPMPRFPDHQITRSTDHPINRSPDLLRRFDTLTKPFKIDEYFPSQAPVVVWRLIQCRSGGIGRRAWFRSMYSQGCGGSSPFFGTNVKSLFSSDESQQKKSQPRPMRQSTASQ